MTKRPIRRVPTCCAAAASGARMRLRTSLDYAPLGWQVTILRTVP